MMAVLVVVGLLFVASQARADMGLGLGSYVSEQSGNVIPTLNLKVASIGMFDVGVLTNLSFDNTNDYCKSVGVSLGLNGKKVAEKIAKKSLPGLEKLSIGWVANYYFVKVNRVGIDNELDNGVAGIVGLIKF